MSEMAKDNLCDVAVVGGGPVGLTLARALDRLGLQVTVFESSSKGDAKDPKPDGREIALTHASRAILESLGIWERLPATAISPLVDAAVFDGEATEPMKITHTDGGRECLGFLVSNQAIKKAAYETVIKDTAVDIEFDVTVESTTATDDGRELTLKDGRRVRARLVVAADSRFSNLRRIAGIGSRMRDYGRSMLLARMSIERDHEHIASEWFGYDRNLALLPLNGSFGSAVITLPHEKAERLAALDEADFNEAVSELYQHRFGQMQVQGERHLYPLIGVWPDRLVDDALVVMGDAAVGMHPVTAHGFNLGLKGVKILAEELAKVDAEDIANPARLSAYQRRHRMASLPLYLATSAIVGLYSETSAPAKLLRRTLIRVANNLWPFRRAVARQLTG